MDLKTYVKALKARITTSPPDLDNEDSVLGILYEAYSESNALYDDEIKNDFHALYEAMHGLPLREMDKIVYPVCTLCRDHQKSGFIEGVRIGVHLCTELIKEECPCLSETLSAATSAVTRSNPPIDTIL